MGSLIMGNGATNASALFSKVEQNGLSLGCYERNGNRNNVKWCRKMQMKGVYCGKASQCRGPLWNGRVLSNDVIQTVQAMRRANGDQLKVQKVFDTRVSRLLKADLLAVLQELHRQDECHLALKVFDTVRKEMWYKPDLSLYVSVIMALERNNLIEKVDPLFEDLKKESLQPDTKAFTRLMTTFLRVGLPQHAIETYELMKQTQCKMDDYTFAVLIKGLQRLREPDLADAVIKEYRDFFNDPIGYLKDTAQDVVIS